MTRGDNLCVSTAELVAAPDVVTPGSQERVEGKEAHDGIDNCIFIQYFEPPGFSFFDIPNDLRRSLQGYTLTSLTITTDPPVSSGTDVATRCVAPQALSPYH